MKLTSENLKNIPYWTGLTGVDPYTLRQIGYSRDTNEILMISPRGFTYRLPDRIAL